MNMETSFNSKNTDYGLMFEALKEALKEVKIVMNDKEFGTFVIDTMERAVYS